MSTSTTAAKYAAYTQANHEATSPVHQVIMAFEYMIKYVTQAREAMQKGNIEERYNDIDKTVTIIEVLQNTLDHKKAPELCAQMESYYEQMHRRLMSLQYEDNESIYNDVTRDLKTMLETWREVETQVNSESKS